jgi:hypothetical protein
MYDLYLRPFKSPMELNVDAGVMGEFGRRIHNGAGGPDLFADVERDVRARGPRGRRAGVRAAHARAQILLLLTSEVVPKWRSTPQFDAAVAVATRSSVFSGAVSELVKSDSSLAVGETNPELRLRDSIV